MITSVSVNVGNASAALPTFRDDESYSLDVGAPSVSIACARIAGCLHALTTLGQLLLPYDFEQGCYSVQAANISDAPRFPHRGLMLDTSRHFYPTLFLRLLIDAMAAVKLNVLHWHLADDQAFPFQVPGTRLLPLRVPLTTVAATALAMPRTWSPWCRTWHPSPP
jgi:hexosaminidase